MIKVFSFKEMSKGMVYINNFDTAYLDLLFINDSKYIEKEISDMIIALFYIPATHIIFVHQIKSK